MKFYYLKDNPSPEYYLRVGTKMKNNQLVDISGYDKFLNSIKFGFRNEAKYYVPNDAPYQVDPKVNGELGHVLRLEQGPIPGLIVSDKVFKLFSEAKMTKFRSHEVLVKTNGELLKYYIMIGIDHIWGNVDYFSSEFVLTRPFSNSIIEHCSIQSLDELMSTYDKSLRDELHVPAELKIKRIALNNKYAKFDVIGTFGIMSSRESVLFSSKMKDKLTCLNLGFKLSPFYCD